MVAEVPCNSIQVKSQLEGISPRRRELQITNPYTLNTNVFTRMPNNLGMQKAPFLVLGNFIRSLGLQKGKKGPLGNLV